MFQFPHPLLEVLVNLCQLGRTSVCIISANDAALLIAACYPNGEEWRLIVWHSALLDIITWTENKVCSFWDSKKYMAFKTISIFKILFIFFLKNFIQHTMNYFTLYPKFPQIYVSFHIHPILSLFGFFSFQF